MLKLTEVYLYVVHVSIIYFRSLYQAMLISNGNKEMCFAEPLNNVIEHFCALFISVFKSNIDSFSDSEY
jgi:hypothetical protein